MVAVVARWLAVAHLPELIVEDMLADTIDLGLLSAETRERMVSKHGTVSVRELGGRMLELFNYRVFFLGDDELWLWMDETGEWRWHRSGGKPALTIWARGRCPLCSRRHSGARRQWRVRGRQYREDGPASECRYAAKWYIDGDEVPARTHYDRAAKRKRT